jgi:hypothetical protein
MDPDSARSLTSHLRANRLEAGIFRIDFCLSAIFGTEGSRERVYVYAYICMLYV